MLITALQKLFKDFFELLHSTKFRNDTHAVSMLLPDFGWFVVHTVILSSESPEEQIIGYVSYTSLPASTWAAQKTIFCE